MIRLLPLLVLSACAARPDAYTGVTWVGATPLEVSGAEAAAMCLAPAGLRLPADPFVGVTVEVRPDYRYAGDSLGDHIIVRAGVDAWAVVAHELVHVALLRYRPDVPPSAHHKWMEQRAVCFGGCNSFGANHGCE